MDKNESVVIKKGCEEIAKQSTSRQIVAIIFILALAARMFLLPIFLIRETGRDGYIALAVGGGIDLLSLGLWIAVMVMSPDEDFFSLLKRLFGEGSSRVVAAFIALFLFFKLSICSAEVLKFYSDNVFSEFNTGIMTIALLIFLASVGSHTLRSVSRINELMVPVIVISVAALITIVAATRFDLANIFPALRRPREFGSALCHSGAWLGDFTPLALFVGKTKLKKRTPLWCAMSGIIGTAVTVFFAIVMCAAFGNASGLADSSTNLANILQFSLGNVYGRIDLFSSVLWSVASFIETALFFYATCRCISYVVGKDDHSVISLCVCVVLYFVEVFAMTDPTVFTAVLRSYASSAISLAFTLLTPAVALICAAIGRYQRARLKKEVDA